MSGTLVILKDSEATTGTGRGQNWKGCLTSDLTSIPHGKKTIRDPLPGLKLYRFQLQDSRVSR